MKFAYLLGLSLLLLGTAAGYSQTIPPNASVDLKSLNISQSAQDDFYSTRRETLRKSVPRILFVPGILGSKIDECRADGSQCKSIWGTVDAIRRRDVDLGLRTDRVYRTDVVDSLLFKDVYGGIIDYIRQRAETLVAESVSDPLVTIFPYDWRASNAENANLLRQRICDMRAHAGSSPIVIIAHSMGGLVTKVWAAKHAKEPCAHGTAPAVSQIVFVATPHLGSPKSVKAIAEGYNIFFDELTGLKRYLGWFERNYLLDAINQAGVAFPSLYELLPIRSSEYCMKLKPVLAKASVPVAGDNNAPVNLFDIETWRRYDLLRRIGAPVVRRSYYDHDLAPLLANAERLLCDIADFDPASVADVVYLYGREKDVTTYGWFHLHSGASDSIDNSVMTEGDGTVPIYSAQNYLMSSTRQTTEVQADHVSIINSSAVLQLIDDLYANATRRADLQMVNGNTQFASLLTVETAASGKLIPVSLDPTVWSKGDDKAAIEINTKALALMGYKTNDVALYAAGVPDPIQSAKLYAVAASSTSEPSQQLIWVKNVARSSYGARRYSETISSATFIDAATQKLPSKGPEVLNLQKAAKQLEGWAYLREGDVGKFNELATSFSTKYAVAKEEFREPNAWEDFAPVIKDVVGHTTISVVPAAQGIPGGKIEFLRDSLPPGHH